MRIKLENHWYKYKFDYISLLFWIIIWIITNISYDIELFDWTWWSLVIITVGFRFIGLKEGRREIAHNMISNTIDVVVRPKVDESEEVIFKLKDIEEGTTFGLSNQDDTDKYIKCLTDGNIAQCWNITKHRFDEISDDLNVIVYKTKTIYIPIITLKKDN